jgi:hypothetical protein
MAEERTVYIIGAGFSHGYDPDKYPLMGNFFKDFYATNDESSIWRLSDEQINFFQTNLAYLFFNIEDIDIEEALAYTDIIANGPVIEISSTNRELDAMRLKEILYFYIRARLGNIIKLKEEYKQWIGTLNDKDYIITFNYDLLIEGLLKLHNPNQINLLNRAFKTLVEWSGTTLAEGHYEPGGMLLKLHGSLDWYTCPNNNCLGRYLIELVPLKETDNGVRLPVTSSPLCRECRTPLERVIIYPAMQKRFERYPKLLGLWSEAWSAINAAERIVVIGYSFRELDINTSFLLRRSLYVGNPDKKSWIIIDPSEKNDEGESRLISKKLAALLPRRGNELEKGERYKNLADYMAKHKCD